jgi:hypothetical protein
VVTENETQLDLIMARNPELSDYGFGTPDNAMTPDQRAEFIARNRRLLLSADGQDGIERASRWLVRQKWTDRVNKREGSSYALKHIAEREVGYITNGQFIAAALVNGMVVKRCDPRSPNAWINISLPGAGR